MAKSKKMTQKEKKYMKQFRDEMRAKGILPPKKKPLNRKKFAEEVLTEFENFNSYGDFIYLARAVHAMVSNQTIKITSEQVGVLKLVKIAMEWKKFQQGKDSYTVKEIYEEVMEPIYKL